MKNLKKRLGNGETLLGCWLNLGSAVTAEIVGLSGFDWVLIDIEHGMGDEKEVLHQLQALEHTPAASVVRVEGSSRQRLHRVLDLGAEGIMCPRVDNAEEARQVVGGLRYPPKGRRGVATMVRAVGYGKNFAGYLESAEENILGIIQVESAGVLDHLDEIAGLDGVDVLFIGPNDLSMALGIHGQFEHPQFHSALQATVDAARKAGKATGILLSDPDDFRRYSDMGFTLIACGADAAFVARGASSMIERLNARSET